MATKPPPSPVVPLLRLLPLFLAFFSSDAAAPLERCEPDQCVLAPKPAVPTLRLDTPITLPWVLPFAERLQDEIKAGTAEIHIIIDSPGGSVPLGLGLIEMTNDARKNGMRVTCEVAPDSMAASMAAMYLEAACDTRTMHASSVLLFHEISVRGAQGTEHDLRRIADSVADAAHRLAIMVAPKLKLTVAAYEAWVRERDRWLSPDEALERHAVDAVVP